MTFESRYDVDSIVFHKPSFRGLTPFRVKEVHFRYYQDNQDEDKWNLDLYYTIANKQIDERYQYVKEDALFSSEAQAVAKYMESSQ